MVDHIARAEIDIAATPERIWQALTEPEQVKRYFFGTDLVTDWQPGSPIYWRGEWEGKPYEDKGEIVQARSPEFLQVTHFSPMTGQADVPENYHTITYELTGRGEQTHVVLSQDNNGDADEAARATQNWKLLLDGLKKLVEG